MGVDRILTSGGVGIFFEVSNVVQHGDGRKGYDSGDGGRCRGEASDHGWRRRDGEQHSRAGCVHGSQGGSRKWYEWVLIDNELAIT